MSEKKKTPEGNRIKRHKTAIKRRDYSSPIKALLRDGLAGADDTIFDYGCGHGSDIRLLTKNGYRCSGWDPAFRPDNARTESDVVNLGFVINVIEDPDGFPFQTSLPVQRKSRTNLAQ